MNYSNCSTHGPYLHLHPSTALDLLSELLYNTTDDSRLAAASKPRLKEPAQLQEEHMDREVSATYRDTASRGGLCVTAFSTNALCSTAEKGWEAKPQRPDQHSLQINRRFCMDLQGFRSSSYNLQD